MNDLFWGRLGVAAVVGAAASVILVLDRAVAARQHGPGFILAMTLLAAAAILSWPTAPAAAAKNGGS